MPAVLFLEVFPLDTFPAIVELVRTGLCVIVSAKKLREAVGHDRLGAEIRKEIETKLLDEEIGLGNPIPNTERGDVLLYDNRQSSPVRALIDVCRRVSTREAWIEPVPLDLVFLRTAALALRDHCRR